MSIIRYADGTSWQLAQHRSSDGTSWNSGLVNPAVSMFNFKKTSTYNVGSTGISVTKPTGAANGDIIVVAVTNRFNNSVTAPTDFTLIGTNVATSSVYIGVWYRVLDGTETWPYLFTSTASNGFGWILSQTLLRNASGSTAPLVNRKTGGNVTRGVTTGIVTASAPGSYMLQFVSTNTARTTDTPDMTLLGTTSINSTQQDVVGKRLLDGKAVGLETRYNIVVDTFSAMTVTFASKN